MFTSTLPAGDPTAVVGRRIVAYGIDLLIMAAITTAFVVPMFNDVAERAPTSRVACAQSFENRSTAGGPTDDSVRIEQSDFCVELDGEVLYIPQSEADPFTMRVYGIAFCVQFLLLVILQGIVGASLGKLLLGLRVIREDGTKAGLGWALLRWVLLFIDALCCFLPGAVLVFTTRGHRRLGDMAAKTFVVPKAQMGTPPSVPGVTAPQAAPTYGQPWGTSAQETWIGPTPSMPPTASTAPTGDGPMWDEARDTYIQYDRAAEQWVQWDERLSSWRPIDQ